MRNMNDITEQDARRFRMALLRAKLTRLAVTFEDDADEAMLERLVAYAERQRAGDGAADTGGGGCCKKCSSGRNAETPDCCRAQRREA